MSEIFRPRGLGLNWIPCFICGRDGGGHAQPDCAFFVENKEAGERVVAMFAEHSLRAKLDFRDFEPNRVQVKVGACVFHVEDLEKLVADVHEYDNRVALHMLPQGPLTEEGWRIAELENALVGVIGGLRAIKEQADKDGIEEDHFMLHILISGSLGIAEEKYKNPSRTYGEGVPS